MEELGLCDSKIHSLLPEGNWIGSSWRQLVKKDFQGHVYIFYLVIINDREGDDMIQVMLGASGKRLETKRPFLEAMHSNSIWKDEDLEKDEVGETGSGSVLGTVDLVEK